MAVLEHFKCPLNRYTFSVTPIRKWVERECEGKVLNLFAGKTRLGVDEIRNDCNPEMPAEYHLDALVFLNHWNGELFDTVLLDPPYSYRKSMEMYSGKVCSPFYQLKDAVPRLLKPQGLTITFGYHSIVMGAVRRFDLQKVAVFSHGGAIHDTIASVERYVPDLQVTPSKG